MKKSGNKYTFEQKHKMKNYTKANKTAVSDQIVLIGDSIIDFYDVEKYLGGYDVKVYNRGISGETSSEMLTRLDANALNIKPRALFILIGTNDVSRGISFEETISNITSAIDRARAAGVRKVYVESIYPVNRDIDKLMVANRTNDLVNAMNEELVKVSDAHGATYINIHDSLMDSSGAFDKDYTVDGLHPNAKGYEIVTRIISPYIK